MKTKKKPSEILRSKLEPMPKFMEVVKEFDL